MLQNVREDVRFHLGDEARHYFELVHEGMRTAMRVYDAVEWSKVVIRLGDTIRQLKSLELMEETPAEREVWATLAKDLDDLSRSIYPRLTNPRRKLTHEQNDTLVRVSTNFWNSVKKYQRNII